MSEVLFKIDDIVEWCGVAGIIVKQRDEKLFVKFTNHITAEFFPDGKYRDWHFEPSLKYSTEELLMKQALDTYNIKHKITEA